MTPALPAIPPLSDAEAQGFSLACACMARLGLALAKQPSVAGPLSDVMRDMRGQGLVLMASAAALERQIGQGALRRPRSRPGKGQGG